MRRRRWSCCASRRSWRCCARSSLGDGSVRRCSTRGASRVTWKAPTSRCTSAPHVVRRQPDSSSRLTETDFVSGIGSAPERARASREAPSQQFTEALAWQARGEINRADAICEQLLREQPLHADAWHLRGLLAFQTERLEWGIELIEHSLGLNALQPAAHANIGSALLQLQRSSEALEHFD